MTYDLSNHRLALLRDGQTVQTIKLDENGCLAPAPSEIDATGHVILQARPGDEVQVQRPNVAYEIYSSRPRQ